MPRPRPTSAPGCFAKRVALCLLFGSIVQYVFAVSFALDEPPLHSAQMFAATVQEDRRKLHLEVGSAHAPGKDILAVTFSVTDESGLLDVDAYEVWPDWSGIEWQEVIVGQSPGIPTIYRSGAPPSWLRADMAKPGPFPDDVRRPGLMVGLDVGCGWPWRSASFFARWPWPESNGEFAVEDGLIVENAPTSVSSPPRVIPLHIIWPGAIANTLVYAAGPLVPFTLIPMARRHFRQCRGRCTNCNYDLRATTTGTCPECGEGVGRANNTRPIHYRSRRRTALSTLLLAALLLVVTNIAWSFAFEPLSTRFGRYEPLAWNAVCGATVCPDEPAYADLAFLTSSNTVDLYFLRTIATPDGGRARLWPDIDGSVPGGYNAIVPRWLRRVHARQDTPGKRRKGWGLMAWTIGWPFRLLWCSEYYWQVDRKPRPGTYALLDASLADRLPAWLAKRSQYMPYRPILLGQFATLLIYFAIIWFMRAGWRLVRGLIRRLRNHCPACNYNLHLNTTGVCPECGTAITPRPTR